MAPKLWFISGCSSGLGAALAHTILLNGDCVIATARDPASLQSLRASGAHCMQLDITDSEEHLAATVAETESKHGPIDFLVNNASYTQSGAVEELSIGDFKDQFDTTFFGTVKVTKAVLPYFRRRKSGIIFTITSVDAHVGRASFAAYTASKHAVKGFIDCLREDVRPFGIRVVEIAPGTFRTPAITHRNLRTVSSQVAEYQGATNAIREFIEAHGTEPGDPSKLAEVIVELAHRGHEGEGEDGVEFLPLGNDAWNELHESYTKRLAFLEQFKELICSTDFE